MNYNHLVTRTCIPSHADLTNISYTHAGGAVYTGGVKRTADEAGIKQEFDSESVSISSDDDDLATSYAAVTRAMNVQGQAMPNIPHTMGHLQGMTLPSSVAGPSAGSSSQLQPGKPPNGGKKTKGRVKIKMEFIDNKLRRYTTFSKRKTGIMKKAYELSTLTGTQVMLLVASETGHVYTFATRKLQPMITSDAGKALIQTCLNSPDPPPGPGLPNDQRMMPSGFEETELSYNVSSEEEQKGAQEASRMYKCEESRESSPVSSESGTPSPTLETNNKPSHHPLHLNPRIATLLTPGLSNVPVSSNANGETPSVTVTKVPSTTQLSVMTSPAMTTGVTSPVMYQTAQGVVYAVPPPHSAMSEGLLLNLGSYLHDVKSNKRSKLEYKGNPGASSNIITIPIPASLSSTSTETKSKK